MKIISQTPNQMILRDSNYWGIFMGSVVIIFGILFIFSL